RRGLSCGRDLVKSYEGAVKAATASMAVPLISARRPTTLGGVLCIMCLPAMFCRLPRWLIANGLLDLGDERLCVARDRLPFFLADRHDHHAVGSEAVNEDERVAPAADVGVGQIRSIEHEVRVRCGARDAAVLVDAVAHRRQHVRDAGPRRRVILAALEALRHNRLDLRARSGYCGDCGRRAPSPPADCAAPAVDNADIRTIAGQTICVPRMSLSPSSACDCRRVRNAEAC